MMQSKQPTATVFTRTQESWANFVLEKVQKKIDDRESWLKENGWKPEELSDDSVLMDLYDDELFYMRYAEEMARQRTYLRKKYFNDDEED